MTNYYDETNLITTAFYGITADKKLVNNPRFYLNAELNFRMYFFGRYNGGKVNYYDLTAGLGLTAGYKF